MTETDIETSKAEVVNHVGVVAVGANEIGRKAPKLHNSFRTVTLMCTVSLAVITVFGALFYFVAHGSLTDIYIGSVSVKATESEVTIAQKVQRARAAYTVPITYADGSTKRFTPAAVGITIDAKLSAGQGKQLINSSFWERLRWWQPIKLPLTTKTNTTKLEQFVAQNATHIELPPKDAGLAVNDDVVSITPEVIGKGTQIPNAKEAIAKAVTYMDSAALTLKPTTFPVAIVGKDLHASKTAAEAIIKQPVSFNVAGRTVAVTPSNIGTWLDFSPVPKSKTVDVTVNSGKILEYINSIAADYTWPARNRLVINTNEGAVLLDAGSSGMDVVNKDKVAATVSSSLMHHKAVSADLPIQYIAAQTTEVPAYAKWIVADVTTKRMYAYEGTNLVRSFLISAGAPATPTAIGQFKIYRKYISQDMSGANADGSRYYQPAVPYVNYFYGGYAIHGNYWRPAEWFGNINSSHGCLGVTVDDGAWIYDWATVGTPVITHR